MLIGIGDKEVDAQYSNPDYHSIHLMHGYNGDITVNIESIV